MKDESVQVQRTLANDIVEEDFVVGAAYPNPFNPTVTVSYQLSTISHVSASVYNMNGILIENLLNDNITAGSS